MRMRGKMKVHDEAKLQRKISSRDKDIDREKNRALKYQQFVSVVPITTREALDALTARYRGKGKDEEYSERLRDQLRLRQHCYKWKKGSMVAFGGGHGDSELGRLELALCKTVAQAIGEKDTPPLAHVLRPVHPSLSAAATQQEIEHLKEVSKAALEIMQLAARGVFRMPRSAVSGGGKKRKKVAAAKRPRKARRVTSAEKSLVRLSFEGDSAEWKVINVAWSAEDEAVGVWYCGVLDAER